MKAFVLDKVQDRKPNKIIRSKSVTSFDGKVVPPTRFSSVKNKEAASLASRAIIVATAVAVHGLDIPVVTDVDNMPDEVEKFVHRIGSTGHVSKVTSFFDLETDPYVAGTPGPDWLGEDGEHRGGGWETGLYVAVTPVPDLLGEAMANSGGGEESDPYVAGIPVPDWFGESWANSGGGGDAGGVATGKD